uniref:YitH acetyltransferase (GNAT) domain-containing protein n=1 Tax=Ditylenchus dipsaci TaxID=166011 RepID=A0A915EFB9_9BILA
MTLSSKEIIKVEEDLSEKFDGIVLVINPPNRYCKELTEEMVAKEGWDNSHYCYDIWKRSFGPVFKLYCAFDKKADKIVGCKGVLHCSMYYVQAEYRQLKLGLQLCDKAYSDAPSLNLFCYGVASMYNKYKAVMNFDKFANWRLQTTYARCSDIRPENLDPVDTSVELKHWRLVPLQDILAYDKVIACGINREAYLTNTVQHPDSLTMVATKTGQLVGVCQIRELVGKRLGISLFYADNEAIARSLLKYVLEEFPKSRYRSLDSYTKFVYKTPSTNENSCQMFMNLVDGKILDKQVLVPQFTKEVLQFPTHLIYSICDEHSGLI